MKKLLVAVCVAATMVSCGSVKNAGLKSLDGEWNVTEVENRPASAIKTENKPFIGFNTKDKTVYGSAGCNRLTGALNADAKKGTIDFSALGSTRMMCREMEMEQAVLGALGKAVSFKVEGSNALSLADASGAVVMRLEKK